MFMSLRSRLLISFLATITLAVAIPYIFARNSMEEQRFTTAKRDAFLHASYTKKLLEDSPSDEAIEDLYFHFRQKGARITVLDPTGYIQSDSEEFSSPMQENYEDRPEVIEAREKGVGYSIRKNTLTNEIMLHVGVLLDNGGIIRLAIPFRQTKDETDRFIFTYSGVTFIAVLLAVFLSFFYSRRLNRRIELMAGIVQAISQGKYNKRLRIYPGEEFAPLAEAVHRMAANIEQSLKKTREQQEELETILESMNEGVLVLDPGGNIVRYNSSLEHLFPEVISAMGKQIVEALPVALLQRRIEELMGSDMENLETLHFEYPVGRFFMVNISRSYKEVSNVGVILVFSDITELMRLERIRRDFVANVSHELRTPLTAITGYAETLMNIDEPGPECQQFAKIIYRQGTLLAKVVADLLALARIENRDYSIELTTIQPIQVVKEILQVYQLEAAEKSISFIVNIDPEHTVQSNYSLLTQIFRNLLDNAFRYSPKGKDVVISSTRQERSILFSVMDHGPGIPPGEHARIFERFYQVEKNRNTASAGIGLAICKHLVERHGGRIWVESPYENFSTAMMFTIPTEMDEQQTDGPADAGAETALELALHSADKI